MKIPHTIMLTYDRIEAVEVDLGIDTLRGMYGAGCMDEQFVRWLPERFAMQVRFDAHNDTAERAAVKACIIGLYRTIPESKVANLVIWVDNNRTQFLQSA